jgi:hypothetical protein
MLFGEPRLERVHEPGGLEHDASQRRAREERDRRGHQRREHQRFWLWNDSAGSRKTFARTKDFECCGSAAATRALDGKRSFDHPANRVSLMVDEQLGADREFRSHDSRVQEQTLK